MKRNQTYKRMQKKIKGEKNSKLIEPNESFGQKCKDIKGFCPLTHWVNLNSDFPSSLLMMMDVPTCGRNRITIENCRLCKGIFTV